MISKVAGFLRLIDEDGKLNIADLAFMIILTKIALSSTVDWPSMIVLATTCLNSCHQRHIDAKNDPQMIQMVQDQTAAIQNLQQKVSPILDTIKEKIS